MSVFFHYITVFFISIWWAGFSIPPGGLFGISPMGSSEVIMYTDTIYIIKHFEIQQCRQQYSNAIRRADKQVWNNDGWESTHEDSTTTKSHN